MINREDFEKIDIRAGTIIKTEESPQAKKPAYQLTIDFGKSGIKRSSAQITTFYNPEELPGKQVIAVINSAPLQIAGFISECLVLGVCTENKAVVLLEPE